MPPDKTEKLSNAFAESAPDGLRDGQPIRRSLPCWGRIHIDRPLPFLFLYRKPSDRSDEGTGRLLLGEAAYVLAPGSRGYSKGLSTLIRAVADTSLRKFSGFLLVEVSADDTDYPLSPTTLAGSLFSRQPSWSFGADHNCRGVRGVSGWRPAPPQDPAAMARLEAMAQAGSGGSSVIDMLIKTTT